MRQNELLLAHIFEAVTPLGPTAWGGRMWGHGPALAPFTVFDFWAPHGLLGFLYDIVMVLWRRFIGGPGAKSKRKCDSFRSSSSRTPWRYAGD